MQHCRMNLRYLKQYLLERIKRLSCDALPMRIIHMSRRAVWGSLLSSSDLCQLGGKEQEDLQLTFCNKVVYSISFSEHIRISQLSSFLGRCLYHRK